MTTVNYDEYIQSPQWKALAAETKRLAGNRCQVCYSDGELHAHHRTYERLGHELQSDLVALCGNCHALFHGKHDVKYDNSGWALVKSLTTELSQRRALSVQGYSASQIAARSGGEVRGGA